MNMKNNRLVLGVLSVLIVLSALTFTLLNALLPFDFLVHPILNFLLIIFVGFGILAFCLGLTKKSPWFIFISNILLSLSVLYLTLYYVKWWISLLIVVVFAVCVSIISVMRCGNVTEQTDNNNPNYKNYFERKKEQEGKDEEQEIPELKSFK